MIDIEAIARRIMDRCERDQAMHLSSITEEIRIGLMMAEQEKERIDAEAGDAGDEDRTARIYREAMDRIIRASNLGILRHWGDVKCPESPVAITSVMFPSE